MALCNLLVEGRLDAAVGNRLLTHLGHETGTVYGQRGYGYIQSKVKAFTASTSRHSPLLVICDFMDTRSECPPAAVRLHIRSDSPYTIFRLAVNEIESWLLADRSGISSFLAVSANRIPRHPEGIEDPKRELVGLALRSRRRRIREGMVPVHLTASEGPEYTDLLIAFIMKQWDIDLAASRSRSLEGCMHAIATTLS